MLRRNKTYNQDDSVIVFTGLLLHHRQSVACLRLWQDRNDTGAPLSIEPFDTPPDMRTKKGPAETSQAMEVLGEDA